MVAEFLYQQEQLLKRMKNGEKLDGNNEENRCAH